MMPGVSGAGQWAEWCYIFMNWKCGREEFGVGKRLDLAEGDPPEDPEAAWAQGGSNAHERSCTPEGLRVIMQCQGDSVGAKKGPSQKMYGFHTVQFQLSTSFSTRAEAPAADTSVGSWEHHHCPSSK